jgi:hypothetical protein
VTTPDAAKARGAIPTMTPNRTLCRAGALAAALLIATAIGAKPVYAVDDNTKTSQKKAATKDRSKQSQDSAGSPGYPNEPPHGSGY